MCCDDPRRAELIGQRLARLGAPIVGLCEVWDDALARALAHRLRVSHPYLFRPKVRRHPLRFTGSGLLLLSRYPLHHTLFAPYRRLVSADRFSRKGIVQAAVDLPNGSTSLVFLTHTQAERAPSAVRARRDNLSQLRRRMEQALARMPDAAPLLLGDLNVQAEDRLGRVSREFSDEIAPFLGTSAGLTDLYRAVHPDTLDSPGHTWDGRRNRLAHVFHPRDSHRHRLDFVFGGRGLSPVSAEVLTDFVDPQTGMDLSDHYPLRATVKVG